MRLLLASLLLGAIGVASTPAAAHGKLMSFPEYASNVDDGEFAARMAEWIKRNNVAYHSWWNSRASFDGDLRSRPANLQAFRRAWGR